MSDLAAIPTAPRTPRWRAAFRHRWLIGVLSGAVFATGLLVVGILASTGIDLASLDDDVLDAESRVTTGEVRHVEASGIHHGRVAYDRIDFRYRADDGTSREGVSFATAREDYRTGQTVDVEFAPGTPEVARVRGTRRNPIPMSTRLLIGGFTLVPLGVLLWWLRGAMRTRLLLTEGRLVLARIESAATVFGVNPEQIRVTISYADDTGREHRATQWIGRRSPPGERIAGGAGTVPAIHALEAPARVRIVHPADFVP